MKTTLSHLPDDKQEELETLTEIIVEKVPAEMVILFGSHARGDWVEDFQEHTEYVSDYDILVITTDRKSAKDDKKWWDLNKRVNGNDEQTSVTIIHHSIGFVNDKIERNEYFFVDILKEGIVLFDSGKFKLSQPKNMNPGERQKKAKEQFEPWFESASRFLETTYIHIEKAWFKEAAFNLHQATERYYSAILLVFTDYKPKIHDIEKLGNQVEKLHSTFGTVFPKNTPEEKRLFELLQKAYIDSRYNMNYKIEKEELEYLADRVKVLKDLTERICNERIAQFGTD
ncbi:HEPN domain-containing protein [Dyadobacter arcticus]|uniref:HEPN domain-containing protein/predicted nucleotidyltransferase n=1 Tax=Dyadobacter arcticus TaxID=1078754 RepID=A0ABX0UMA3_9BACT|nr:HEPN domain-containing protein [Dyadobacter arcticus]NIJ52580.1 HEPN domain-containing protein/predicted nucleotidyltransferase [Dyadobacter arcticus]